MNILVTGGAGYLGSVTTLQLLERGHTVRIVDNLLHGQTAVAKLLADAGAEVMIGDLRDPEVRTCALARVRRVVHLGAIVGDVACREDTELSDTVNLVASRALIAEAGAAGVEHLVFASTCSNYGIVDHDDAVDETYPLRPVSRYAQQKVAIEAELLDEDAPFAMSVSCLRFATLYGASPRMRFDLLVNEFARDLWGDRTIEVYGARTWRPYVHVTDAARAIVATLAHATAAPGPRRATFNIGIDESNHRKLDVAQLVARTLGQGEIVETPHGDDTRTYRVSFARMRKELDVQLDWTVERGAREIAALLDSGQIVDPYAAIHVNA